MLAIINLSTGLVESTVNYGEVVLQEDGRAATGQGKFSGPDGEMRSCPVAFEAPEGRRFVDLAQQDLTKVAVGGTWSEADGFALPTPPKPKSSAKSVAGR